MLISYLLGAGAGAGAVFICTALLITYLKRRNKPTGLPLFDMTADECEVLIAAYWCHHDTLEAICTTLEAFAITNPQRHGTAYSLRNKISRAISKYDRNSPVMQKLHDKQNSKTLRVKWINELLAHNNYPYKLSIPL